MTSIQIDDSAITARLDNTWRTVSCIKNKLGLKGDSEMISDALRRLAEAGVIERLMQDTATPKSHRTGGGFFSIEYYRRRQAIIGLVVLFALVTMAPALARDLGQWKMVDPATRDWYEALMQPDNPAVSCCGEADSYWVDSFEVRDGKVYAIVTDDRPDEPLKRRHVDIGTKIEIPNNKLVDATKQQNPTGHGIIFLSRGDYVYCYVAPGGV
jgi:hypothetical protein